ncbi:MAG TPA: D-alanyl-D-alanine carboxypeptidase/D-alanyl-D-alanine-endopeptidase [Bryobacteraceae bacterium]|nr:D-alanyl-D-alanine carboxypeptidase/D-alanyl-D-alanine-endopeptidase [Bryobacteraceae bacterium]
MRVPCCALAALALAASAFAADPPPPNLAARLDALADAPIAARASLGIHVLDLKTGKTLYARNENRFFLPASNMKIFTGALALEKLGANYRFVTRLVRDPAGNLVLVGSGDPSLSGRTYPYKKDAAPGNPLRAIEELAAQAVAAGLTEVNGDVAGDDRRYPWSPYPPSWTQEDAAGEDGAPVSALTLNDNLINVTIRPGPLGEPALLTLAPALEYFAIDNRVTTVAGKADPRIHVDRVPGTRQVLLSGSMPAGAMPVREIVAMDDPALFAACALYDALTRRGVVIRGRPVAWHRAEGEPAPPVTGEILARRTSPPLKDLLQMLEKVSENLHAELVLRETGHMAKPSGTHDPGSREAGLDALAALIKQTGGVEEDYRLEDGSGLSRNAQVTPRLVTRMLAHMWDSPEHDTWLTLLPVGGEDGTLANRLCCVADASHAIVAKTGTLARALALSGYADSKTNGRLAFSILVNNFAAPANSVRAWIDKMALALVD